MHDRERGMTAGVHDVVRAEWTCARNSQMNASATTLGSMGALAGQPSFVI